MKHTCDSYHSEEQYKYGVSINIKINYAMAMYTKEDGGTTKNMEREMTWKDGDVYEGEWKNGMYDGQGSILGRMVICMKESIKTTRSTDKGKGLGMMAMSTKESGRTGCTMDKGSILGRMDMDGEYKDNKKTRKKTYADGVKIEGYWENGSLTGDRTYIFKYGFQCKIDCDFDSSRIQNGTIIYPNGDKYVGQWKKIQIQILVQYLYNMVGEDYINITVMMYMKVIGMKTNLFLFLLIKEEE